MRTLDDLEPVHSFAVLVREYDGLVAQPLEEEIDLHDLARLLSSLVSAAFALPDLDEDAPDLETSSRELAKRAQLRFSSLANIVYSEVFDAFAEPGQCVSGSLVEDLQGIYADLKQSLALYDAGHVRAASRDWRFNFTFHWGEHATSAVRALYWHLRHNG